MTKNIFYASKIKIAVSAKQRFHKYFRYFRYTFTISNKTFIQVQFQNIFCPCMYSIPRK